jgi:hypothetical protein
MFERSRNRLEYLCYLYGRPVPSNLSGWSDATLPALVGYIDGHPPDSAIQQRNHRQLMERVTRYGVALTDLDRQTLRRFHDEFVTNGLDIQYTTRAGPAWRSMPTNRDLYLATDQDGNRASYLSSEARWRAVKALEQKNRVVPVVGDLAGNKAMPAIAHYLVETHQSVSVFYVSNVEQYLFRQGSFPPFVANVRALPFRANGVLVRSVIGGPAWSGPAAAGTLASRQRAQPVTRFFDLTVNPDSVEYWTLITDTTDARFPSGPPPAGR